MRHEHSQAGCCSGKWLVTIMRGTEIREEAVIHAMHRIFEADDTDAILLIDASNAFNALNRAAALHNIRVL